MYTRPFGGTRHVVTPKGPADLHVHLIGPHPILEHFLDRMSFSRIVHSCLGTPREGILDHAQSLGVLIHNIILSPAPLYRIAEWAQPIEPSALGLTAREKKSINDDRIARSLDALASPKARNLFFLLALHIIKQFELDTQRIHHDTTTVTFQGQYKRPHPEPRITHGFNKEHRPDLKQLVFGLNVTADGAVPISHEVYSGNRTDDTVHRSNVDRLREILGRDDFIYVADSKLCTRKNLAHLDQYGGKFVTVMPRSRAESKQFRNQLREGARVRWYRILEMENGTIQGDPPDIYWTTSLGPTKSQEGYRIVWLRSSQKAKLESQARQASLKKAEADLEVLNGKLNRGPLRKRETIQARIHKIQRKYGCKDLLQVRIGKQVQIQIKRMRRGRPRKGDPVKQIRSQRFHLEVQRNQLALRAEARTDGVFPLITNLDPKKDSKKQILLIYKYQPYVEKRHSLFKTELKISPPYIKKPSRAAGLVHSTFLAMTLDALIERTLRQGMQREKIDSVPILPEDRSSRTPTTARLLEMFSGVSWYEFEREGERIVFPVELTALQKQLLRLLGMNPAAYG